MEVLIKQADLPFEVVVLDDLVDLLQDPNCHHWVEDDHQSKDIAKCLLRLADKGVTDRSLELHQEGNATFDVYDQEVDHPEFGGGQ